MGGLTIPKATAEDGGHIIADRKLYRTEDGRVVEAGDAGARYLLTSGAGDVITSDQAKALRLEVKDGKVQQAKADPDAPVGQQSDAEKDALAIGLKKAADAKRQEDMGKSQTEVAITEPPAVDEGAMAASRARSAADAKPVPETATAPKAAKKKGK